MENLAKEVIIRNKLSALKCSVCKNVLSIPPIKVLSADGKILQCGRCDAIRKTVVSRNYAYEEIAQLLSFPCIYNDCEEMIPWAEVQQHEEHCTEKTVICPIDSRTCKNIKVKSLEKHCLKKHPDNIFFDYFTGLCRIDTDISVPLVLVFKKQFFFILLSRSCELSTNYYYHGYYHGYCNGYSNGYELCSYVASLNDNTTFTHTLKLSSTHENFDLSFEKQKITKYVESEHCFACMMGKCSLVHHPYSTVNRCGKTNTEWCKKIDLSATKTLFGDMSEIKIEIEIVDSEDEVKKSARTNEDPIDEVASSQANHLRNSLQCPICMEYMIAAIFNCAKGHALCNKCWAKIESCPTCRTNFDDSRNYPLENLAKVLVLNCTNSPRGCNFSGQVKKLSRHEKHCRY